MPDDFEQPAPINQVKDCCCSLIAAAKRPANSRGEIVWRVGGLVAEPEPAELTRRGFGLRRFHCFGLSSMPAAAG